VTGVQVVKGKFPFERIEMTKDEALEMFKYNDFKIDVLKRKVWPVFTAKHLHVIESVLFRTSSQREMNPTRDI